MSPSFGEQGKHVTQVVGGRRQWQEFTSWLYQEPFLVPLEAGANEWRERLRWLSFFACNSITVLSFCGGVWASSMSIPNWGTPHFCTLAGNSSYPTGSSLATPCFRTQPSCALAGPCLRLRCIGPWHGASVIGLTLSCLPQNSYWALLWALRAPFLSQLISLLMKTLPQNVEPLLTHRSLFRGIHSILLLFHSLISFILLVVWESFSSF